MDQGDALSPDWLDLKALIGTQGYCLIPIKFTFALLTTTTHRPPWLVTLLLVCPLSAGNLSTGNKSPASMLATSLGPPSIRLSPTLRRTW